MAVTCWAITVHQAVLKHTCEKPISQVRKQREAGGGHTTLSFCWTLEGLVPEPTFPEHRDIYYIASGPGILQNDTFWEDASFNISIQDMTKPTCVEMFWGVGEGLIASWCHPWLHGSSLLTVPLLPWRQSRCFWCYWGHSAHSRHRAALRMEVEHREHREWALLKRLGPGKWLFLSGHEAWPCSAATAAAGMIQAGKK